MATTAKAKKEALKNKMEKLRRAKTGFELISTSIPFRDFRWHVRTDVSQKDISDLLKGYVKEKFTPEEAKIALAAPDHAYPHYTAATIYWKDVLGKELPDDWSYDNAIADFKKDVLFYGEIHKQLAVEKAEIAATKPAVQSPADKLKKDVDEAILSEIDALYDEWAAGKKTSYDAYGEMQKKGFKANAAPIVVSFVKKHLTELKSVINKEDPQLVEGYSQFDKKEISRQISVLEKMILDLQSFKAAVKATATKKIRAKKEIPAAKLVAKLKFKKADNDYKIVSVDPTKIIGSRFVYLFNTKNRKLTMLESKNGFSVKGSAITGFDNGYTIGLRKPLDVLPMVVTKTTTQIEKIIDNLTTKKGEANGRLNDETIIVKVV